MIYIPDIFEEIVDSIRETGNYTGVVVNGNQYTLTAKNTLSDLGWITVNGYEYKVISRTDNDFTIESETVIPNEGIFKSLEPYYLYGHRLDIANRLLEKDNDELFKYQKYPLIALRLPITQEESNERIQDISLNLAIMAFTDQNYPSEKRYENVIKPILTPIYQRLIQAIKDSSSFNIIGDPVHKRVDRLFWGIEEREGNSKYIFNDPLDAIEVIDLQLKAVDSGCAVIPRYEKPCPPPEPPQTFEELKALVGQGYAYPQPTGQTTIYRTGDDADIEQTVFAPIRASNSLKAINTLADFFTLNNNNVFGNTNRFTDIDGLQVYGDNYIIDNYSGLAIYNVLLLAANWGDSIDNALLSTQNGFSDWFVPNGSQYFSIFNYGEDRPTLYNPISLNSTVWLSNTESNRADYAYRAFGGLAPTMSTSLKTATFPRSFIVRKHF